jgi:hypothetical protein
MNSTGPALSMGEELSKQSLTVTAMLRVCAAAEAKDKSASKIVRARCFISYNGRKLN